jgi:PAS domain S-box-containing protein
MASRWGDTDSQAWAAIPLVTEGDVLGVLGVSFTAPRMFTVNERLFMSALTDLAALALRGGIAERLLPRSTLHFEAIVAHGYDLITVVDKDRRIVYASPAFQTMLGRDPRRHTGRFGWELVHPDDRPHVTEQYNDVAGRPGGSVTFTCRLQHADGSYRHVEIHQVNRLHDPAVRGFVGNMRDITNRSL